MKECSVFAILVLEIRAHWFLNMVSYKHLRFESKFHIRYLKP